MKKTLQISLRTAAVTLILTGIIYPYLVAGLAQILFPFRANGSLVADDSGKIVGSELIAQGFTNRGYFHPRPSAAGEKGYDGASSSASNLGPSSKKLRDRIIEDLKRLKEENPDAQEPVPVELVTTSASGLDPHLAIESARWQVPRIAQARRVAPQRIEEIIESHIEGRQLGFLGEPRVNVLLLNLGLDRAFGRPD
jgi:potassium-transporting ATPase KdpC subunit